jgi:hypothetical protein
MWFFFLLFFFLNSLIVVVEKEVVVCWEVENMRVEGETQIYQCPDDKMEVLDEIMHMFFLLRNFLSFLAL